MSQSKVAFSLALVCFLAGSAATALAGPLTPSEERYLPWTGEIPACDTPQVLWNIQTRFQDVERQYWKSGLEMTGFDRFRQTGYRSTGLASIPRRYCTARAFFNDGKARQITYWIGEDLGFAGGYFFGLLPFTGSTNLFSNWGVTFCVNGLDRQYAYGLGCMAAGP